MKSLCPTMTIKEIVTNWPETLDVFIANGFENFSDAKIVENVGRFLKLESALARKNYAVDTFVQLLNDKIAESKQQVDITLVEEGDTAFDIDVAGCGCHCWNLLAPLLASISNKVAMLHAVD